MTGCRAIDANFEASWAPVDHVHSLALLDDLDRQVRLNGTDVATVHQAARHILVAPSLLAIREELLLLEGIHRHLIN